MFEVKVMTIYELECFVVLSQCLNFTKAASLMNVTQPAFSRHISAIERELDAKLFFPEQTLRLYDHSWGGFPFRGQKHFGALS